MSQPLPEEYSIDALLAQRLAPFRAALGTRGMMASQPQNPEAAFSLQDFEKFIVDVRRALPDPSHFNREIRNIRTALETGKAVDDPDLSRPETQLAWGAALLLMNANLLDFGRQWGRFDQDVTKAPVWQQLEKTPYMLDEMYRNGFFATESLRNPSVRFQWGAPGTAFYYIPDENLITIDMALSLITGMEHTRAIVMHEVSHSQLTVRYPDRQQKIRAEIVAIEDAIKARGEDEAPTAAEYKRMRLLSAEWQFRHMLFDGAENNCVNRNSEVTGHMLGTDIGYSLNHSAAILSEQGQAAREWLRRKDEERELSEIFRRAADDLAGLVDELLLRSGAELSDENRIVMRELVEQQRQIIAEKINAPDAGAGPPPNGYTAFVNAIRAVSMAFYQNNGLIENTLEGWHKLGIYPEWIQAKKPAGAVNDNGPAQWPNADFDRLLELCSGRDGLENLRPALRDIWQGRDYYNELIDRMADRRCEITEQIWDEYLAQYASEMMKKIEEQVDKEIDEAQNPQNQQKQQKKKQKQQGQQQGEGGEQGEQSEEGEESGEEQEGQEGEDGEGQDGDGQEGQEQDGEGQEGQSQQEKQGKQSQKKQKQQQKESGQKGEQLDASKTGTSKDDKKVDMKTADGRKERMQDIERPPEKPQHMKPANDNEGQDGESQDGDAKEGKRGKTLQEIQDEMKRRQEEAERKAKEDAQKQQQGQKGEKGQKKPGQRGDPGDGEEDGEPGEGAGAGGEGKTLEEIARMDWSNYPAIVAMLMGPISQVARALEKIREKQVEKDIKRTHTLECFPENNEIDRMDEQAHRDMVLKDAIGQAEERDLDRFQQDAQYQKPTQIDIALLIDGSGSMEYGKGTQATQLEIAILSATIMYEAAKKIGANVYIAMWGSANPVMIARPGDDPRSIAKNIVAARNGLSSGTDLAPSIRSITKEIARHAGKGGGYRGYTHITVFSDGDIYDREKAQTAIDALLQTVNHVTLDFAIIKTNPADQKFTDMEKLAAETQSRNPAQKIGVVEEKVAEMIPPKVVALLLEKISRCESFKAITAGRKKSDFRRAQQRMEP